MAAFFSYQDFAMNRFRICSINSSKLIHVNGLSPVTRMFGKRSVTRQETISPGDAGLRDTP